MNSIQVNAIEKDFPIVVHVVTSLDFGGVERHMEAIACAMERSFHRHIFVAIGDGGAAAERLRALGADVVCLEQKPAIPSIGAFWALMLLFRRLRPLVVHAHGAEANFHGLPAALLAGVPVRVGEEIGIPSHSRMARLVFSVTYKAAHRVIGISQSVVDWLVASGEVPRRKGVKIYVPVLRATNKRKNDLPKNLFRIGFVGRLETVKNVLALLAAFEKLVAIGHACELWIVGDGTERFELERRVLTSGLSKVVRVFGYQSDPTSLIRQCHIYVQPSLSEGFGLALVEAMSCGVPVIATAVGGAPEIVEDGETGWLLPESNPECILQALIRACNYGQKGLAKMGEQAYQSVFRRFEPDVYIADVDRLYEEISRD